MPRVHAQAIGLLRKQGNFKEALDQVDELIKAHPRALEPLMEKGYILEGLAEKEPARFDESVSHWVTLRSKLQALRPKPPEYYEVMYRVAACLVREAEKTGDKAIVLGSGAEGRASAQGGVGHECQAQRPRHGRPLSSSARQGDRPARPTARAER